MNLRASLLTGTLALGLVAAGSARAQDMAQLGNQAEWRQNYDAVSRIRVQRSSTPILSAQALAATEETIERYRDIVSRGGWPSVAAGGGPPRGSRAPPRATPAPPPLPT